MVQDFVHPQYGKLASFAPKTLVTGGSSQGVQLFPGFQDLSHPSAGAGPFLSRLESCHEDGNPKMSKSGDLSFVSVLQ